MPSTIKSKIGTLLLLYLVQGIPYGLQSRFLPIYLRTQGMSLTNLGFFKILLIPWALKVFWAPLVDKYATKRRWLLSSLAALALTCLMATYISPDHMVSLCVIVFSLNLFAATQDIAVDGMAIQILTPEELGAGNTVQVVGYKVGAIFGGGVLVWLIAYTGWSGMFLMLAVFYAATFLAASQLRELRLLCSRTSGVEVDNKVNEGMDGQENKIHDNGIAGIANSHIEIHCRNAKVNESSINSNEERTKETQCPTCKARNTSTSFCGCRQIKARRKFHLRELAPEWIGSIFQTPYSTWTMCYVILYKLGEQGAIGMFPLFLVDVGIPASEVTMWTGVIGQGLSIAGSLLGGWFLSNSKTNLTPLQILPVLFALRLFPLAVETICVGLGMYYELVSHGLSLGSMCLLQLIGGAITTATFTLMMQCSQGAPAHIQATHYTGLATLEVMGKLSFMSGIGFLTDQVGYFETFCFFISLSLIVFPLLKLRRAFYISKPNS